MAPRRWCIETRTEFLVAFQTTAGGGVEARAFSTERDALRYFGAAMSRTSGAGAVLTRTVGYGAWRARSKPRCRSFGPHADPADYRKVIEAVTGRATRRRKAPLGLVVANTETAGGPA